MRIRLTILFAIFFLGFNTIIKAQLKSVIEDFEAYADGQTQFIKEGIYNYGDVSLMVEQKVTLGNGYSGIRAMKVEIEPQKYFGGWGKGLGVFKELDVKTDYFNFYVLYPKSNKSNIEFKVIIEDDDNSNYTFESEFDDQWIHKVILEPRDHWQLVSLELKNFKNNNKGGDGVFNISHEHGRLISVGFDFDFQTISSKKFLYFDFLSFTKNATLSKQSLDIVYNPSKDSTIIGFWSEEGLEGNPNLIPAKVESKFGCLDSRKIGVVSYYIPMSVDGGKKPNLYPDINWLKQLIETNYQPMITFEAHHKIVDLNDSLQPNLYSIVEGWYDFYFEEWARRIKDVKKDVLIRLLHEFNGDWYPWCIVNNNKDYELYIKAYRHIVNVFRTNGAQNAKFVWCPNSSSSPQESWNYFVLAYPGDDYVDFTGLDIFNGAGQTGIPQWRSFRHEGMDSYYLMTSNYPNKPLLICETSSRERMKEETGYYTTKADWIKYFAEAIMTDMNKIKLVVWFNETPEFRVDSSLESFTYFFKYIWSNPYFHNKHKMLFKK